MDETPLSVTLKLKGRKAALVRLLADLDGGSAEDYVLSALESFVECDCADLKIAGLSSKKR